MVEFDIYDKDKSNLLTELNSQMSPEEVVARIQKFNRLDFNPTHSPVIEKQNEMLIEAGYDPDDWTFYSNDSHWNKEITHEEQIENHFKAYFPAGVEYLAIKGQCVGGAYSDTLVSALVQYRFVEDGYSVFVRVRPKTLPEIIK